MDEKKISNSSIIPQAIISVVCLIIATLIRFIVLVSGVDSGTANLVFVIVIGICIVLYLIIWAVLGESVIPWVIKKLLKPRNTVPIPDRTPVSIANDEPAEPALPSITEIKENAEKQLIAKRTEKLNLFLEYTHLTVGPHVSAEGLKRLCNCIARYAGEETLPDDLIPIRVEKLSNFDLFHFGWNMAEYFGIGKKYEVVPWLQQVFANLKELEPSYIKGKLYTSETKRFIIPNTTDIPASIAKLKG
ncbi:magnesium transporter [Alistipes sp.]|jgi:hypothetical protein|uniref:magnesium transporter n=1 Tax=Alistipes sp. TaxID=1872444 RepID=UPI0011CBED22